MTSRPVIDDLSSFWMPFTANRQFKAAPRLIEGAKGMYYRATDGREILDGCAGLWCVNAGHCRDEIVAAIQQQAARSTSRRPSRWATHSRLKRRRRSPPSCRRGLTVSSLRIPVPNPSIPR